MSVIRKRGSPSAKLGTLEELNSEKAWASEFAECVVEVERNFRPIGVIETQEGLAFGEAAFLEGPITNVVADRCAMA